MNHWYILLAVIVKATLILATAGLLSLVLRRASAATRHLVWGLALGSLLLLPVLAFVLPAWRVIILPPVPAAAIVAGDPIVSEGLAEEPLVIPVNSATPAVSFAPISNAQAESLSFQSFTESINWYGVVLSIWLAGVLVVLGRLALGTLRMRRITYDAECLTDYHWSALMSRLRGQLDLPAHISLYASEEIALPVTWGIWRPVILLPAEAAAWSSDGRRIVLLHELAHIKRRDCLTQMMAHWAGAIFWFHPLVWFAAKQMRVERELACDDYVLQTGTRASDYASYLVELAQAFKRTDAALPIAVGMACSQLESRVRAILDPALKRGIPSSRRLATLALATVCIVAPLASLQATSQEITEMAIAPEFALAVPLLAEEACTEVLAKTQQLAANRCKLAALQAKAEKHRLSGAEKNEIEQVQASISSLQEELKDKIALQLDIAGEVPASLPELALPASASNLNILQPEPYPPPLKIRSGKQAAELTPELALAIAAMQDTKTNDQALTADNLVRLKMAGVTPEYIEAIKKAGLEDLSVRQICELKMHNVSPEFIKQAQTWSQEKLSARELVNLKISGVTPEYINSMKQAGYENLPLRKLAHMRMMGVTPEFAAAMKRADFDNLTADQLTQLKIHNVTEEDVRQAQNWGFGKLSVRDILEIKMHGVKPEDAQALKAMGFDNLSLRDLTKARMHGLTASYIKEMRELGFDKLTLDQLLKMKMHGITTEYVRQMRAAGFKNISANDLLRMKIQGIDAILMKK